MSAVKLASGYIELTVKAAGKGMKEITTQITGIEKAGEKAGKKAGEAINEGITEGAKDAAKQVEEELTGAAKKAGEEAGKAAGDAINEGITKGAKDAGKSVQDEITGAAKKAGTEAGKVKVETKIQPKVDPTAAREGVNVIVDAIRKGAEEAGTSVDEIAGKIGGKIGSVIGNTPIGGIFRGAADTMAPVVEGIDHVRDVLDHIKENDPLGPVKGSLKDISEGLSKYDKNGESGLERTLGKIGGHAGNIGKIVTGMQTLVGLLEHADQINADLAKVPGMGLLDNVFNKWPQEAGQWVHDHVGMPDLSNADGMRKLYGQPQASTPGQRTGTGEHAPSGFMGGSGSFADSPAPDLGSFFVPPARARGGIAGVNPLGRIFGPGTGTSDSILGIGADGIPTALVSNGEGVVRESAMRNGGAGIVAALNKGWKLPGYDDGTTDVGGSAPAPQIRVPEATGGQAGVFNQWLQAQQGKAYQYGTLYDCSGFMSQVYNQLTGRQMPRFNTESDLAAYGFVRGSKPGTFQLGIHHGGGGPNSHMAGTLPDGRNVESGGSGVQIGAGAHGAFDPQFEDHWYLPGSEGMSGAGGLGRSMLLGMPGANGAVAPAGAQTPGATAGRTEGYIPAGAGGGGQAGTSFASGLLNMGAEAINGLIDQAASAASTAVAAGIAGGTFGAGAVGGSQAGAAAAQAALGLGTNAAKRGVKWGFQMAGIGIDAAAEILMPFGVPRLFNTDPTQFMPQLPGMPAAVTTGEKALQGADAGGPVQPGQLPGQQPVGAPAAPAQPGGVTPKAPTVGGGGVGPHWPGVQQNPEPAVATPAPPTAPVGLPAPLTDFLGTLPGRAKGGPVGVYDSGGWLPPGGIAINKSKGLEPMPVFNDDQWGTLNSIANHDVGQFDPASSGGNTYNYGPRIDSVIVKDVEEFERQMNSRGRLEMMRNAGRP